MTALSATSDYITAVTPYVTLPLLRQIFADLSPTILRFNLRYYMWDGIVTDKVALDKFLSKYISFPFPLSFLQCSIPMHLRIIDTVYT
jgi:hypothetical protein